MPNSLIFNNIEDLSKRLSEDLLSSVASKAQQGGAFHMALSGGNTPRKLFKMLADDYNKRINWGAVQFWWGDERCVPADDPESNFGSARETLLSWIDMPEVNIHPMLGETDPEVEAVRYAKELKSMLPLNQEGVPVFDWILLGIGSDGHTASLFPSDLPLDYKAVTLASRNPRTGQRRISLGATVICSALKVSIMASGSSKAGVVERVFKKSAEAESYPIFQITRECEHAEWLLDREAASGLV
ncbi:6-phosphogluconolactonase [Fibrobacterota bacterium]